MFINNLTDIVKTENLEEKYYICDMEKAKDLTIAGFLPVSVISEQYFVFYKSAVLMEFLLKGEIK